MIRRRAWAHPRLGTSIGAGWDADPRSQGGGWETQRQARGPETGAIED